MTQLTVTVDNEAPQVLVTPSPTPQLVVLQGTGPQGGVGPAGEDGTAAVIAHIEDETPHEVYDNGPSLALLYENAKV